MSSPDVPRAEVVGSLLQSDDLLAARQRYRDGALGREELAAIEDAAVLAAIDVQESVGLDVISDGELRRRGWADTVNHLEGIEPRLGPRSYPANPGAADGGTAGGAPVSRGGAPREVPADIAALMAERREQGFPTVVEKVRPKADVPLGVELPFLLAHAHTRAKYTMAAPSYHRRYWSDALSQESGYGSCEEFLSDVRDWLRSVAASLVAEGCTYIQLDAPNYGSLCDTGNLEWHRAQGHDVERELAFDAALDSSVFDGLDVRRALHICRGNLPGGAWHSSGGYAAIAEHMFPHLDVDVVLLEYDSDRAGDFGPLGLLPAGTQAVLGLLTTKEAALEAEDDLVARIEEAGKSHPLDDLAVSTQCGFASASNAPMSSDEQRAKLDQVVRVARRVWT